VAALQSVDPSVATVRGVAELFAERGGIMLVPHGTIILVLDGARMKLFRNRGTDFAPELEPLDHSVHHAVKTAELGSDKPGRSFNSQGHSRSTYKSTDFHQTEEDGFAKAATETLNALAVQSKLDFIVVATPHVLGVMRKHYSAHLRTRLAGEIDKDYAARPAADIAVLLRDHEA
jgi:protein required for attachment to host cells